MPPVTPPVHKGAPVGAAVAEPAAVELELDVELALEAVVPKAKLMVWITKRRGKLSSPTMKASIWL